MTFRKLWTAVALLLAASVVGCAGSARAVESAAPAAGPAEYRIGPADVLQISVWRDEALSRSVPVRPDGMITLPLIDEVRAAGLTPMELRDVLVRKLSDYMPNSEISVIVEEVNSYTVSVLGEVRTPGRYEVQGRANVLDVLAQAGGFTEFATRSRILVLRPNGSSMRRIPFNYDEIVSTRKPQENLFLQPGDIVLVP